MKSKLNKFIGFACFVVMASYAKAGLAYSWQDIKQEIGPAKQKPATVAYVKIYTKEETVNDGGYLWQRGPRYAIFSDTGRKIRDAENEFGNFSMFALPPGRYVIVPEDKQYKNEITGAILDPGKITEVHIMGG